MQAVELQQREPLMNQAYFQKWLEWNLSQALDTEKEIETRSPDKDRTSGYMGAYKDRFRVLHFRYSRGESIEALQNEYAFLLRNFSKWAEWEKTKEEDLSFYFKLFPDYTEFLSDVSLGLLLKVSDEQIRQFSQAIDNEGKDLLFEALLSSRIQGRRPAKKLLFPKVYQPLYDVFGATPEQRPALVKAYLEGWYKSMRKAFWWGTHLDADLSGAFHGYWSWEAGAVTYILEIDDSSYRDMLFYPKDLVAFARS